MNVDFNQYAYMQSEQWDTLKQQLKQLVDEITSREASLEGLEKELSSLRQSNTSCLLELNELCEFANKEKQRAISLTLNDMDDDIVIDRASTTTVQSPENAAKDTPPKTRDKPKKQPTRKTQSTAKKQSTRRASKGKKSGGTEQTAMLFSNDMLEEGGERK